MRSTYIVLAFASVLLTSVNSRAQNQTQPTETNQPAVPAAQVATAEPSMRPYIGMRALMNPRADYNSATMRTFSPPDFSTGSVSLQRGLAFEPFAGVQLNSNVPWLSSFVEIGYSSYEFDETEAIIDGTPVTIGAATRATFITPAFGAGFKFDRLMLSVAAILPILDTNSDFIGGGVQYGARLGISVDVHEHLRLSGDYRYHSMPYQTVSSGSTNIDLGVGNFGAFSLGLAYVFN